MVQENRNFSDFPAPKAMSLFFVIGNKQPFLSLMRRLDVVRRLELARLPHSSKERRLLEQVTQRALRYHTSLMKYEDPIGIGNR